MLAVIVLLTLAAPTEPPKFSKEAEKELKKLEGRWKVVKFGDSTGESEANRRDLFWSFKGAVVTLEFGREKDETLQIAALDPDTDPKCIDLIESTKGQPDRTFEAVYKIDGDTLQLALHVPKDSKQRPTGFDKPTDRQTIVWTLKRVKE